MVIDDLDALLARARGCAGAGGAQHPRRSPGRPGAASRRWRARSWTRWATPRRARADGRLPPRAVGAGAARPARPHGRAATRSTRPATSRCSRACARARTTSSTRPSSGARSRSRSPARSPSRASIPLVVTEGNYLLVDDGDWARVRPLLDEAWYVEMDEDTRLELADPAPHRVRQDARRGPRLGDAL